MGIRPYRTRVGDAWNEGARLLGRALAERGWSQADLRARIAGRGDVVAPGVVHRWVYGDRRPGIPTAVQLEELLGIPITAWHEPARGDLVPLCVDDSDAPEAA